MSFTVKELFFTLQGEGVRSGQAALFCRFSGCNLWNGKEADRARAACTFCDTNFVGTDGLGGGVFLTEENLVAAMVAAIPGHLLQEDSGYRPYVVLTGGEPALQVTPRLIALLHEQGFEVGMETNGSLPVPEGLDWITVSPKSGVPLFTNKGDELKLVWPQAGLDPKAFLQLDFKHFVLQPCDNATRLNNMQACVVYCLGNPAWRLGIQAHKVLDIP